MTIGEKIRYIRKFRNMTQLELGLAIGLEEKSAANRIAQYESNYRVPKKDMLIDISEALNVNTINFIVHNSSSAENIMMTFFWLDEDNRGIINLFPLVKVKNNGIPQDTSKPISAAYTPDDYWPVHSPVGIWFDYGIVDIFLHEWMVRKQELSDGVISNSEYVEWKLNWPRTCDECGKLEPRIQWRKS